MRLVLADPVGALSKYDLKSLDAVGQNIIHISDRNEGFFVQNCSVMKKKKQCNLLDFIALADQFSLCVSSVKYLLMVGLG